MKKVDVRGSKNSKVRREHIISILSVNLNAIGKTILGEEDYSGHCENPIGATQIPVGVAGPLRLEARSWKLEAGYIPLATTEGALVASVNRGCKVVTQSGGAIVEIDNVGITRGPVFKVPSITKGRQMEQWLMQNLDTLNALAQETSTHIKLLNIFTRLVGRNLYMRFSFDTQDAMGMNMATIATQKIVDYIENKTGHQCIALAGNFDIDKKPAYLNSLLGRGYRVWAEVVVKKQTVVDQLHSTSEKMADVVYRKSLLGSALSGSLGFNAHYANIIAAIYAATGQDLAHVVEGSLGMTTAEVEDNGDLYFSVYLPAVVVGTVGGGTGLPTQKEALSLLGVWGGNNGKNASKFAGIIGVTVLAGELSLTASIAEGSLAKTHEKFRKKL